MNLNLLIASRGRPVELQRTLTETAANIADPANTTISVALDWDDESMKGINPPELPCKLIWNMSAREDSLGAKYNRAADASEAHAYVLGADDNVFTTPGWDERIRSTMRQFNGEFGFIYFGRLDGTLPTNFAVPHQLKTAQGGRIFPPFFPFWFHDTWIDEIAHLAGRILWTDIKVEEIHGRGKSRGIRDVAFWAGLFDATRPPRIAVADALSQQYNPGWLQMQLLQRRDILSMFFASRMLRLRDPQQAHEFEQRMSFDAPEDERYKRIKAHAETILQAQAEAQKAAAA